MRTSSFVEKDLLPTLGDPTKPIVTSDPIIMHDAEGIYWIVKDVIGIHYQTKDDEIKVCLRLGEADIVCDEVSAKKPTCKLVGDIWIAKASIDIHLNMATGTLSFVGTACVKAIWKAMQWYCLPNLKGNIICWS